MKDIDFDELDKAVTSLMGNVVDVPEPRKQDDDVTTLVIPTTHAMPSDGVPAESHQAPAPVTGNDAASEHSAAVRADGTTVTPSQNSIVTSRPAPLENSFAPSPASRRSGRFMDVVHPSSDMIKPAASPVSRRGGLIEPLNPIVAPKPEAAPAPREEPVEVPTAIVDPVPERESVSEWPDPLDMPGAKQVLEAADEQPTATPIDTSEPLSSPFLPDAKVEKRPLGGFPQDMTAQPAIEETEPLAIDQEVTSPAAETVNLPEELRGDLMAIESRQADLSSHVVDDEPAEVRHVAAMPVVTPSPQPTGPASIPQQYKEAPSTGDKTNGAIYDTDAYHKPLQYPAKKKSSWIWIVWVVVLLILGAGGGAAAYIFLLK